MTNRVLDTAKMFSGSHFIGTLRQEHRRSVHGRRRRYRSESVAGEGTAQPFERTMITFTPAPPIAHRGCAGHRPGRAKSAEVEGVSAAPRAVFLGAA